MMKKLAMLLLSGVLLSITGCAPSTSTLYVSAGPSTVPPRAQQRQEAEERSSAINVSIDSREPPSAFRAQQRLSTLPPCPRRITEYKHLCFGIYTHSNGSKYAGEFLKDLYHGEGALILPSGSTYVGSWKYDKRHGEGISTRSNGKVYEGVWKDDIFEYAQKVERSDNNYAEVSKLKTTSKELRVRKHQVDQDKGKRRRSVPGKIPSYELESVRKEAEELRKELIALRDQQKLQKQSVLTDTQKPKIDIVSSKTTGKRATIRGRVRDNIGVAEVSIGGGLVSFDSKGSFEYSTFVPSGGKDIVLEVTDLAGLSNKITVSVSRPSVTKTEALTFEQLNPLPRPVMQNKNAIALIVGVDSYKNTPARAIYADSDATAFTDYASEKLGISSNRIKVLVNEEAMEADILLSIKEWLNRAVKKDQSDVYVFFAGHGLASDDGEQMYLLPYDGNTRLLEDTAILRSRLFSDIESSNPRSVTVFLDTCYSGTTRAKDTLIASRPIVIKARKQPVPDGFTVMTAAGGTQTAKPLEEAEHGMFSYFLMKGLEGMADANNDKKITAGELHQYVKSNVLQQSSGSQTPELQGDADRVMVTFQ
jgi:hypothetical protein